MEDREDYCSCIFSEGSMRTLGSFLTLLILAGCAGPGILPYGQSRKDPASMSPINQYKAAQEAFQKKLDAATGLTLSQLKTQWGEVRQGITHNKSTVYNWVRTITVIPPPDAADKLGLNEPYEGQDVDFDQPLPLSCMAVFIVNQDRLVEEAFSEGRCLDHSLMPGWKPVVEKSDGPLNFN
jgi:hypothetical protein